MNNTVFTTAVVSAVTGGVLGGVITYAIVNRALRKRYEDWANAEIADVKVQYALLRKETNEPQALPASSDEMQKAYATGKAIIDAMGYSESSDESEEEEDPSERQSIFDREDVKALNKGDEDETPEEDDEPWWETVSRENGENYTPEEGEPFMISEAAYFENEPEYTLDTLTYYEIDETLTDEANQVVEEIEATIGMRHLHMFHKDAKGRGKNSIYIQNDMHETLYEVILVEGSYAAIILGMDEELLGIKAPKERPRRMRDGD